MDRREWRPELPPADLVLCTAAATSRVTSDRPATYRAVEPEAVRITVTPRS